jgi:endonuclease-3 related protein
MVDRELDETKAGRFHEVYRLLYEHFGPQGWWPGETPFETMVGAVLTQNTSWSNVAKAIAGLKDAGLMTYESLSLCSVDEIAQYIKSSGYYNLKAKRLRNLLDMIENRYDGRLDYFLDDELPLARERLLEVKGIGPETADLILLYACGHPIFVVDMYTHRVFSRHNMIAEETDYQTIQDAFMTELAPDPDLFNEFHALVVRVAATYCKKTTPLCDRCPLQGINQ